MKKDKIKTIIFTVMCLLLALAITLQVRTMATAESSVTVSLANDELKNRFLEWQEKYNRMTEALEESSKELEDARASSAEKDDASKSKTDEIDKYNMLLGLTNVTGEGIVITCKDGQVGNKAST